MSYSTTSMSPDMATADEPSVSHREASSKIATLLRVCGSILIVFAAISFLLQGVEGIFEVYRYWVALAMIVILSGCGVLCAYLLKESKGARLFFALAGAFLAVQATQLSAMLHGYIYGNVLLDDQQFFAWWQFGSVSLFTIIINFLATVLISTPVVFTTFSLLARKQRKLLCTAFIITNLALLLPFRDAQLVPVLIVALLFYLRFINRQLSADSTMRLFDGILARVIVWVPVLIMISRSMLYPVSILLPVSLLAYVSLWLLYDVKRATDSKRVVLVSEMLGVATALIAWLCLMIKASSFMQPMYMILPVALLLFFVSEYVQFNARLYRLIASLLTAFICFQLDFIGYASSLVGIISGLLLMVAAIRYQEKLHIVTGLISFFSGLVFYMRYVMYFYHASPWLSAIALGLTVLLLASYIESREKQIVQKSRDYYAELKSWN